MHVPLEIAFHNMPGRDWAEEEIRARVAKLEKLDDRIVSCRVRVEQQAKTAAAPPVVHIELRIAGNQDLVVSHGPEHLLQKFQRPDLRNAIHEAFRIAEDRVVALKNRRQGRTKDARHDGENQFLGTIAELTPGEDFGFLVTKEGGLLYFHRNSLLQGDFDKLQQSDEVFYVEAMGDTGPIAIKVRAKAQVA
jgi:hypothetical protein